MTKMGGGLKSGIKQQDLTRRLDDSISSKNFDSSRKPTRFRKHVKSMSEHAVYLFIGLSLFFCAIRFTLQTWFPTKVHTVLAPILGKNSGPVERVLTGQQTEELEDPDAPTDEEKEAADKKAAEAKAKAAAAAAKKNTKKHGRRHKH
ncbi:MAG TPA: hypothetical protein V6C76_00875 [Drouetiella sp.]